MENKRSFLKFSLIYVYPFKTCFPFNFTTITPSLYMHITSHSLETIIMKILTNPCKHTIFKSFQHNIHQLILTLLQLMEITDSILGSLL